MSHGDAAAPGDQARASVFVAVSPPEAFRVFTEEIDLWWRRGSAYRVAGKHRGIIHLEPRVGGRLFESFDAGGEPHVFEAGQITVWSPPRRLVFEWRAANFAPTELTEVEVTFEPRNHGTYVTVTHRGWSKIRPDHPVRHGLEVPAFVGMMARWWGQQLAALREHATGERDDVAGE
jgi:uncharacterized protein YndB with AHSA1/START domain